MVVDKNGGKLQQSFDWTRIRIKLKVLVVFIYANSVNQFK